MFNVTVRLNHELNCYYLSNFLVSILLNENIYILYICVFPYIIVLNIINLKGEDISHV